MPVKAAQPCARSYQKWAHRSIDWKNSPGGVTQLPKVRSAQPTYTISSMRVLHGAAISFPGRF